jgi:hypothetical protein
VIRASYILESISTLLPLNERNVVNIPELEDFVDEICKSTPHQEIKVWFQKRYLYYLKELYPVTKPVTSVDPDSPDWLQKALDRGDEVIKVGINRYTTEEAEDILDCFTQLYDLSEFDLDSKRLLEKLLKTPMDKDFLDRIQDIMDNLAKAGIELVPGIVTSGYKWFKLKSPKAIKTEGEILGLCLKDERLDYAGKVRRGAVTLYSMRKHTNDPKATMEVDRNGLIVQVKGLHDEPPKGEYVKPCVEFINYGLDKGWFKVSKDFLKDLDEMGLIYTKGRVYDEDEAPDEYKASRDLSNLYYSPDHESPDYNKVKALLERGANPNVNRDSSYNPVSLELQNSNYKTLELLFSYKAEIKRGDLFQAVNRKTNIETLQTIKKYIGYTEWRDIFKSSIGCNLLVQTIDLERLDLLKFFLEEGADPNQGDARGNTPLMHVVTDCLRSGFEPTRILLDYGADPNQRNNQGLSSLNMFDNLSTYLSTIIDMSKMASLLDKYRDK